MVTTMTRYADSPSPSGASLLKLSNGVGQLSPRLRLPSILKIIKSLHRLRQFTKTKMYTGAETSLLL